MKSFTLKKKSWHCWLAERGGLYERVSTDICTYTRAVVWGAVGGLCQGLLHAFLAALVLGLLFSLLGGLGWMLYCLFTLTWQPAWDVFKAASAMDVLLCLGGLAEWLASWRRNRHQTRQPKEPGFLKLAAKSVTGKFCVKINLE